jgi:hypothetical protein
MSFGNHKDFADAQGRIRDLSPVISRRPIYRSAILVTVGGATVDRNQMIESHIRPRPGLCLCIDFLKSVVGFTVFMMAFLRLHKILAYLETTPANRCVVKREEVLCAKLLILL